MFALSDGSPAPANPSAVVQGETYRFTVLTPRLIRMEWAEDGEFADQKTTLVIDRDFPVPEFATRELPEGGIEILTEYLRLRYDGKEFSGHGLGVTLIKNAADPHYASWWYGQQLDPIPQFRTNLMGTARTLDEVDGRIELEEGILATYGFAVVDDSESVLLTPEGWVEARPSSDGAPRKDLYFFGYGRDYSAAMRDLFKLSGPIPLVPRQVLGNWWSRYWRYNEQEYLELMDRFRDEDIPLAVAVIDMDWHLVDIDPEIGTGWTGYTWNKDLFPNPRRFLSELHDRGLLTTLNVHPADGIRRHEDAYPEVAQAMGIDPASGLPVDFDITDPKFVDAYLKFVHHPLEEQGVDFWWLDWQSGAATKIPGLDPLWMLNHIHFNDSGRDGKRPLTFSRFAGLGSHRYPVGFSGDTIVTWDSLNFQPEFTNTGANIGYTWWSHDIGGHMHGITNPELTVRWTEYGVFSPIFRLHSTLNPFLRKEPWMQGPQEQQILGKYMRLRHRLVPLFYTAAWSAHTDGVSVVRPMYHDYPMRPEAYGRPNQSMVGQHLLVAPVTSPRDPEAQLASVDAWLPEGGWFDIFTGQHYQGGGHQIFYRSLDQIPVLARAGSVIPLADALSPITDTPEILTLRVYPGNGESVLIEDEGQGSPTEADREITTFVQTLDVREDGTANLTLEVRHEGPAAPREPHLILEVVGASSCASRTDAEIVHDELLSDALRIDLGTVDTTTGVEVALVGLVAAEVSLEDEAYRILHTARTKLNPKEWAYNAVRNQQGIAVARELETIDLPQVTKNAIMEKVTALPAW